MTYLKKEQADMKIRRIILGICWILSLIMISFYGGAVSYGIFFGITLIPVISFLYIFCVFFRYKIYQEIGSRNIVCGQSVPYYFVLQNEDWFAFSGIKIFFFTDFSYIEKLPEKITYELLPGEKYRYETSFVCKYRGEYEIGIRAVEIYDFLGIFSLKCAVRETKKIIAAPKLVRLDELKSIGDISTKMTREAQRMMSEPDVITREYIPGDALKQIHWKVTAREQKLMSRKLTGQERQGAALFFDTRRTSRKEQIYLPIENRILETVLALTYFLIGRNIPVSAFYYQTELRQSEVYDIGNVEAFYTKIADTHFQDDNILHHQINEAANSGRLMDKWILFMILQEIDSDIMKEIFRLSENGSVVVAYVITTENIEEFSMMNSPNRRVIAVAPEGELGEVL